jgi:enediyne biosynthesis protein E4
MTSGSLRWIALWPGLVLFAAGLCGCGAGATGNPLPAHTGEHETVPRFTDVAADAGIRFRQAFPERRPLNILETTGSGTGFIDFDNDGWLDLFIAGQPRSALYRNNGDGTFTDVTEDAGLGGEGFWIGCGAGDYDNDGWTDLFVTGYEVCALYRNNGDGTFSEVTEAAGIRARGWQTSCAFGDIDRDGYLDLYICRYVEFGPDSLQSCGYGGTSFHVTCGPDAYEAQVGVFYRNNGDGTFTEATRQFGMDTANGKAWGAAFADYDDDGWQDLYIANDEMLADLFRNTGRGRMENVGVYSGTACNRDGGVQGGMGCDWGDYDNDGRLDLVVTTFWMETFSLYHNKGAGQFSEVSYPMGIAPPTLKSVGFGTRFADLNNNGWLDLFFVNGHVRDAGPINPEEVMPQRMQLFLNDRGSRFRDVSQQAGEPFAGTVVGRGAAFGDFNNDGRIDIAVVDADGALVLLRNDGPADSERQGSWLMVRALTGDSPRDALGARITLQAGDLSMVREVQTSGSILSSNDPRAHFGLGEAPVVERLTIRWPGGAVETFENLPINRQITLREGIGIVP